ncbi:AraC family transcriptional regulator [Rossellomorea aquimaris]|uniref:AraC family transcriptional regulator n=1 Tax=Rossellomorea aquimaris TaxID=189382 RepID=UPI003CE67068
MQNGSIDDIVCRLNDIKRVKVISEPRKLTNSFELLFVKDGRGFLEISEDTYILQPSNLHIIHPSQVYAIRSKIKSAPIEYVLFTFDVYRYQRDEEAYRLLEDRGEIPLQGEVTARSLSKVMDLTDALFKALDGHAPKRLLFEQLLNELVEPLQTGNIQDTVIAVEEVRKFLDIHYHESISIEQMAYMADVSPKYFSAFFKKEYGISASDYISTLRLNQVKRLLSKNENRIRDIAQKVGYRDEFYLSRKFKATVGMSPSAYRKRKMRRIAAYDMSTIGHLCALNIYPYAAPIHPKWTSYYFHQLRQDIPVHLSAYQINKDWEENIHMLALHPPDMIITHDDISEEERSSLSEIGPVYYYPRNEDWRKQLSMIANHLGETEECAAWMRHYEKQLIYGRNQMKKRFKDETFLPLRLFHGELYLDYSRTVKEVFFHDAGMQSAVSPAKKSEIITLGELAEIDPDHILLNICQESKTLESWNSLQKNIAWNDIRCVRGNQVHILSSDPWREYSPSAHGRVISEELKKLYGKSTNDLTENVHVQ